MQPSRGQGDDNDDTDRNNPSRNDGHANVNNHGSSNPNQQPQNGTQGALSNDMLSQLAHLSSAMADIARQQPQGQQQQQQQPLSWQNLLSQANNPQASASSAVPVAPVHTFPVVPISALLGLLHQYSQQQQQQQQAQAQFPTQQSSNTEQSMSLPASAPQQYSQSAGQVSNSSQFSPNQILQGLALPNAINYGATTQSNVAQSQQQSQHNYHHPAQPQQQQQQQHNQTYVSSEQQHQLNQMQFLHQQHNQLLKSIMSTQQVSTGNLPSSSQQGVLESSPPVAQALLSESRSRSNDDGQKSSASVAVAPKAKKKKAKETKAKKKKADNSDDDNDEDSDLNDANQPQYAETFAEKLHRLVSDCEEQGLQHIASFTPIGKGFFVHDRNAFLKTVAPKYFKMSKFCSLKRQLYLYDFEIVQQGVNKGSFYHPNFERGAQGEVHKIRRICQGRVERRMQKKT